MQKKSKILIIDDLSSSVKMIERFLSEYDVISAKSGIEGLKLAVEQIPDLILLDVVMPNMTGFEVCLELKKNEDLKNIPVIFLTTCNRKEDIDRSFDVGAFDYITKPISGKALKAKIHAVFSILDRIKAKKIEQISKKNEAIEIFLKGMSHNFNNMFGGIIGMSQLLESLNVSEPKVAKYAKMIRVTSETGARLVAQLLEFSQSSELEFSNVDIHELLGDIKNSVYSTNKEIDVKMMLEAKVYNITGDYDKLYVVFQNLIKNADEAMSSDAELIIKSQDVDIGRSQSERLKIEAGGYLKISVCDNGCGVSREIQSKIFEPFFSTCDLSEAKGLGLAEARGIVHGHRGTIEYKERAEGGSEFNIYLPVNKKSMMPIKGMPDDVLEGLEGRILLVDDDDVSLLFADEVLRKAGYDVVTAMNGEEALNLYKQDEKNIDLVLTDIIMPKMNGLELAEELRMLKPDVNVILMSGHVLNLKENSMDWIKAVIKKPFRGSEVTRIINEALT